MRLRKEASQVLAFRPSFLSIHQRIGHCRDHRSIVKSETVLGRQRQLIKHFWTFKRRKLVGRPPVGHKIRQLILSMKNDNLYWGYNKIEGELLKLDIRLDKNTVRNILNDFRRKGKIKESLTWKQFLRVQIHSFYGMDFFTIDTMMRHLAYRIKEIRTSVRAPNMNGIAEPNVGSVRREALDYFLLLSKEQIIHILLRYIDYYNSKRPHQGLAQNVPRGFEAQKYGEVRKTPILGGLCHH